MARSPPSIGSIINTVNETTTAHRAGGNTMDRYTPMGILCIINGLGRKDKELHDAMISMHNRQKTEHPRYSNMTDEEFKRYKIDTMRYFHNKRREIKEEIAKWWKYKEEHKL